MKILQKVKLVAHVFIKCNKKNVIKKVCLIAKNEGILGLKRAVLQSSTATQVIEEAINHNNLYYRQQNEYVPMVIRSEMSVILFIPDETYHWMDSLESIRKQLSGPVDTIILAPEVMKTVDFQLRKMERVIYANELSKSNVRKAIELCHKDYCYILKCGDVLAPNAVELFSQCALNHAKLAYSDECIWHFEANDFTAVMIKPKLTKYYYNNKSFFGRSIMFEKQTLLEVMPKKTFESIDMWMNSCADQFVQRNEKVEQISQILLRRHHHYELQTSVLNTAKEKELIAHCTKKQTVSVIYIGNYKELQEEVIAGWKQFGEQYQWIVVEQQDNESYAELYNKGAKMATGEILIFCDGNITLDQNSNLEDSIRLMEFDDIGALSPKMIRKDNTIRYAGGIAGGFDLCSHPFIGEFNDATNPYIELAFETRETSALSLSCILVKKEIFHQVGGFNEEVGNKFTNLDFTFRIATAGYVTMYSALSCLVMVGGEWYDSKFLDHDKTAYSYMLSHWHHRMNEDVFFTDMMKEYFLNRLPFNFHIHSNEKCTYEQSGRKILLISHELSMTGAPVALHYAAKAIKDRGDYPVVMSPFDGPMRKTIVNDGIPVIVDSSLIRESRFTNIADNFDLVLVCTLVNINVIEALGQTDIPTLWWVHEAVASYEIGNLKNTLPEEVSDNIHIYCGGHYALRTLKQYRPKLAEHADVLLYAVPDIYHNTTTKKYDLPGCDGKFIMSTIGSVMDRKGQDVFCDAIMRLSKNEVEQCKILIIGKMIDIVVYDKVKQLKAKYPDQVVLIDEVSRDELMEVYNLCDCIVCASKDDPMPVFMTEAMMFSKLCICSENTGTASLMDNGKNGFVYTKDNPKELAKVMKNVIAHHKEMDEIRKGGRKIYEQWFTMEAFSDALNTTIDKIITK